MMAEDHSRLNLLARIAQGSMFFFSRMPESRFPDTPRLLYHTGIKISGSNGIFLAQTQPCPSAAPPGQRTVGEHNVQAQCQLPGTSWARILELEMLSKDSRYPPQRQQ